MSMKVSAWRASQTAVPSPLSHTTALRSPDGHYDTQSPSANAAPQLSPLLDETPETAMEHFLHAQETTLQGLLDTYALTSHQADQRPPQREGLTSGPPHPYSADVSSSQLVHTTKAHQRAATAPQLIASDMDTVALPFDTDTTTAAMEPQSSRTHRARLIAELLQRDKESQRAAAVGRTAVREREELKRAVALEEERLALAQKRNATLRARLEALTRERREAAQRSLQPTSTSTALVAASTSNQNSQLASTDALTPTVSASDYTNQIVEARRQLDQRTRELQESQERLHQLQKYHLDQLSGQYRPTLFAEDALRTTENFLDTETNIAVRVTVVDALLEVNAALKPITAADNNAGQPKSASVLPCLENISTLWDRLAVQNFVVGRINRLFTCMCPTAPPLTLLKDTNMM